jgi:DNA invertase Pin-like site-specific DNA recombinase
MIRGYIRVAAYGPNEAEQRAALERAGLTDPPGVIYVDLPPKRRKVGAPALPEREKLTRSLRSGAQDVVLVADASIIGTSWDDMLGAMARFADREAVVRIANTGKEYAYVPRDAEMMDLFRDAEHTRQRQRAAHARRSATAMGKGGVPALRGAKKDKAKAAWRDPKRSGSEVAAEFGVSRQTLYQTFGPRGTPDATKRGRRR